MLLSSNCRSRNFLPPPSGASSAPSWLNAWLHEYNLEHACLEPAHKAAQRPFRGLGIHPRFALG